jgi:sterol desaturase/sphingolipid hydroxylase (fatty acid hydroxylase superfamily)
MMLASLLTGISTVGAILAAMALIALVETVVPLHARNRWGWFHLGPNLALTFITFGTNLFMNSALILSLTWTYSNRVGLLRGVAIGGLAEVMVVVVALDFAFYAAHVAMHKNALLWRFHCVHHSDPHVDVTTTIRQHPGEGVIRYVAMAAVAIPLGASPAAFAIYRSWSVLNGLLEHCNLRLPRGLDTLLSWLTSTPNMHKIHHSRRPQETNTNFSNIFSIFDRLFQTFTPSRMGLNIEYGLHGLDKPDMQTTSGLLAMPFAATPTVTEIPGRVRAIRAAADVAPPAEGAKPDVSQIKWITRENAKVDRIACPWLISRFVDAGAEFVFLPHDTDWSAVTDGVIFDAPGAELGHHGEYCSFDAIIARYGLDKDPALLELGKIVRAADTPRKDWAPEGTGLEAIADGFRRISSDDFENMHRQFVVYDALYAHCQAKLARE